MLLYKNTKVNEKINDYPVNNPKDKCQYAGQDKYPPTESGFISKASEPFIHNIIRNRCDNYKSNQHPFCTAYPDLRPKDKPAH